MTANSDSTNASHRWPWLELRRASYSSTAACVVHGISVCKHGLQATSAAARAHHSCERLRAARYPCTRSPHRRPLIARTAFAHAFRYRLLAATPDTAQQARVDVSITFAQCCDDSFSSSVCASIHDAGWEQSSPADRCTSAAPEVKNANRRAERAWHTLTKPNWANWELA